MKAQMHTTFAVKSWDEQTWDGKPALEVSGEKQTRAVVSFTYQGDLQAESHLQYLFSYQADGSGVFVGLERVEGKLNGREGSYMVQHTGTFDAGGVKTILAIVPGSGSGELKSIRGQGEARLAGRQPGYPLSMEYELD